MRDIKDFYQDGTRPEVSEYALAAALVALVIITAFTKLSRSKFHNNGTEGAVISET